MLNILCFLTLIIHNQWLSRVKRQRNLTLTCNISIWLIARAWRMTLGSYLTIIRRRRSEYWWIFPKTKTRGIFTTIHRPEANNCFSVITQVIIEIPRKRKVFCCKAMIDGDREPLVWSTGYFSCNNSRLSSWLRRKSSTSIYSSRWPPLYHILHFKSAILNIVACLVFLGIAFSFMKLISFSDTMRQCAGRPFKKIALPL